MPVLQSYHAWKDNRRIFQQTPLPSIATSAQEYYKTAMDAGSYLTTHLFTKECSQYQLLYIYVERAAMEPSTLLLQSSGIIQVQNDVAPSRLVSYPDTLKSDWFVVDNNANITLAALGNDTSFTKLDIVKRSDGSRQQIPLRITTDSLAAEILYTLTSGGGNEYRLEFYKTDSLAVFAEQLILGEIPIEDTSGVHKAGTRKVIDLAPPTDSSPLHIAVYPNPADETIFINVSVGHGATPRTEHQAETLTVSVLNVLGEVLYRVQTPGGTAVQMDTSTLPVGVYSVRVEAPGAAFSQTYSTTSFVITR